jgi:hypothetical protein
MQSKQHSFLEACLNTASGFVISYLAGWLVFPMFGFDWTPGKGFSLTMIFTVISVVRSYVWRRIFNHRRKVFDLVKHLERQRDFSLRTFGPGDRWKGVVDHIRKELCEIEQQPRDLSEWIDVATLAVDGAWRSGASPNDIATMLALKQSKNESRQWPDWRTVSPDAAVKHVGG